MAKQQGTRHQSVNSDSPDPHPPAQSPQRSILRLRPTIVMQFIQRHPIVFWSGVWVSMLLLMAIAMTSLVSPSVSNRQASSAVRSDDAKATEAIAPVEPREGLPVWSFAAVFLTCATGCLLMSNRLRGKAVRKPVKRIVHAAHKRSISKSSSPTAAVPHKTAAKPVAVKASARQRSQPASPVVPDFVVEPTVTVVPSEQDHPLDWNESSLADTMDIRRRRPLSRWL